MKKFILLAALVLCSNLGYSKGCTINYVVTGDSIYCIGDAINLSIHATTSSCAGGIYNWYRNGVLITTNTSNTLTVTDTGTYTGLRVSYGSSITQHRKKVHVRYLLSYLSVFNITGLSSLCSGVTTTYRIPAVAGATYDWVLPPGWTGTSTTNVITVVANSSGIINVSGTVECGTFTAHQLSVVLNPFTPAMPGSITGNSVVCNGSTNIYSVAPVTNATSYTWLYPAGWAVGGSASYSLSTTASATSGTIYVRANGGCGSSAYQTFPVSVVSPTISIAAGQTVICAGDNVNFTATSSNVGTTPNYTWKVNGVVAQSGSSNSFSNNTFLNGDIVTCQLTATGVCVSTYTANSNNLTIQVLSLPSVNITTPNTSVCGGVPVNFTANSLLGGLTPSYNWFVDGTSVLNSSSPTFTSSSLTNNSNVACILTSSATCVTAPVSSNSLTMTVTSISTTPSFTLYEPSGLQIGNNIYVCPNQTFNLYVNNVIGGGASPTFNFKKNGVSVQNSTYGVYAMPAITGPTSITCTMTSSLSCLTASTVTVADSVYFMSTFTPTISISQTAGTNPQCAGASATFTANVYNAGFPIQYYWLVNGADMGVNTPTFSPLSLSNGNVITCTFYSSYTCTYYGGITSNPITMTVFTSLPVAPGVITGQSTGLCTAGVSTVTYSIAPVTFATSYIWTPPIGATILSGQGTTSISLAIGSTFTSGNLAVSAINSCGVSTQRLLTLKSLPSAPASISGPLTGLCPTGIATATYTTPVVVDATSYNWTVPTGASITSGQGTTAIVVSFSSTFTFGNVGVNSMNACGSSAIKTLAIKSVLSSPTTLTGSSMGLCPAGITSSTYVTTAVAGASSYLWAVPAGVTITAGQGTTTISASFDATFVSGNVSVMAVNPCGNSTAKLLAVKSVPAAPTAISGPLNICGTTTATYTTPIITGATGYSWTVPSTMTLTSGQSTTSIVCTFAGSAMPAGSVKVASTNLCGTSAMKSVNITACASPIEMNEEENSDRTNDIFISPNPFSFSTTVLFKEVQSNTTIRILDILGKEIKTIVVAQKNAVEIEKGEMTPGMYFMEIQFENKKIINRKIVIR